jgi:glucose/arabinose dehydrogenase
MITAFLRAGLPPCVPAFFLVVFMSGCGDDGGNDLQQPPEVSVVSVSGPAQAVRVGESIQLVASASDAAGASIEGITFEWTSAEVQVATVSQTGLVTGVMPGQVEIRAVAGGVIGSTVVTVVAATPDAPGLLTLQQIASGLDFPLYLTAPPGDARLFIVEKGGAIRIIKDGLVLETPFLDLSAKVSTGPEQGLLGLAFPADYATTGRFVVHYTDPAGDTRVSTFRTSADPDQADPGSESVILTADQPGGSHNGGQILFGPDGLLYIGLGDGGSREGNDRGRAQSLGDLLGAILRIDIAAGAPYSIPPDNPFTGIDGARPEIWNYGFRNPWRFSFDRGTGDVYIADVGEKRWEEVNVSTAAEGAGRGLNYGWSRMEGTDCMNASTCDTAGITLPLVQYDHDAGCSITGGYVYRGDQIPSLQGHYFYADFCEGWVRSFRLQDGAAVEAREWPPLRPGRQVTSFGEDSRGELYLLTGEGSVFKIVAQ